MRNALWKMPARAQAAAVRTGEVSAVELVEAHLERIAEVNPAVNAVTQLLAERARGAAAEVDRRRAAGAELGPLAGVPFTVKETTAIEGVPTTYGAERFRDSVARSDAPPVARLRAAGGIPVGHSNMPTLILAGIHTRSELFGDTVNPWSARSRRAAAVAATARPWRAAWPRSDSATTPEVRCAFPRPSVASRV